MSLKPNSLLYEEIKIGDIFSFEYFVDESTVFKFAELTGDFNPLHMDESYAKETLFGGRIVHGMLLAGLFSTLVGMLCPGERALYLSQDISFRNTLFLGKKIKVEGKVLSKFDGINVLEIKTLIKDLEGNIFVDGLAKIKVR